MKKNTCPSRSELSGYANGTLPPAAADEVTEHIADCAACEDTLESIGQAGDSLVRHIQAKPAAERYIEEPACRQAVNNVKAQAPGTKSSTADAAAPASTSSAREQPERIKTLNLNEFVEFVTTSGLVPNDELAAALKGRPATESADASALAKTLVQLEKLTNYQAAAIYQGRGKSLFYGDYLVLDRIGAGGMGQVFKARHRRMDRIVALKVMSQAAIKDADAVRRFEREVRAAAKLAHPNVVHAYDAGAADDVRYLVMEYVEGCDLSALMKQHPKLSIKQACHYIEQAARGFAAAHAKGIVHRDVKPGNLLIDKTGAVKVLDMGLARFDDEGIGGAMAEGELTQSGSVMGTVDYMSPEQALDTRQADAKSDVYGLGCTLYRALTGEPPYGGHTLVEKILAHRDQPVPSVRKPRPDAPAQLDALLQRMMAKSPTDRPTMQEAADALAEIDRNAAESSPADVTALPSDIGPAATNGTPAAHFSQGASPPPSGFDGIALGYAGSSTSVPSVTAQASPRRIAGAAPPRRRSNITLLVAAGAGGLLLLAGIWIYVKNKEGQTIAAFEVPDGGSLQLGGTGPNGAGPAATGPTPPTTVPTSMLPPRLGPGMPIDVAAERRVAKRVLELGGFLNVSEPESQNPRGLKGDVPLPDGPFTVTLIGLSRSKVADRDLELFAEASQLTDLTILETAITDAGFDSLLKMPYLRGLNISPNAAGRITDAGAKKLEGMTYLRSLRLDGTQITPTAAEALHAKLPHTDLTVSGHEYKGSGQFSLVPNGTRPIAAVNSPTSAPGAEIISIDPAVERSGALYVLERGGKPTVYIPNGPTILIERADQLPAKSFVVSMLDIRDVDFTDRDLERIRGLGGVSIAQIINTKITDEGLKTLAGFKTLHSVFLGRNAVTDNGLQALGALPKLITLNVNSTQVTAAGADRLARSAPTCRIVFDGGEVPGIKTISSSPLFVFRGEASAASGSAPSNLRPSGVPLDRETEVSVAKRVLDLGGFINVTEPGKQPKGVRRAAELPAGPFTVTLIDLGRTKATDEDLEVVVGASQLSTLVLYESDMTDAALDAVVKLPYLRSFGMSSTADGRITDAGLKKLEVMTFLQSIRFDKTQITSAAAEELHRKLPHCQVMIAGLTYPADGITPTLPNNMPSGTVPTTATISLGPTSKHANRYIDPDVERRTAERILDLGGTIDVMAPGRKQITVGPSDKLPTHDFFISRVDLNGKPLSADDVRLLGELGYVSMLDLAQTSITDADLESIAKLTTLGHLNLAGAKNTITDAGFRKLTPLKQLGSITVTGTQVTAAAAEERSELFPKCLVRLAGREIVGEPGAVITPEPLFPVLRRGAGGPAPYEAQPPIANVSSFTMTANKNVEALFAQGELPEFLRGAKAYVHIARAEADASRGKLEFYVITHGPVIMAASWADDGPLDDRLKAEITTSEQLEAMGWRPIAKAKILQLLEPMPSKPAKFEHTIFVRICRSGEKFSIRTRKFNPPLFFYADDAAAKALAMAGVSATSTTATVPNAVPNAVSNTVPNTVPKSAPFDAPFERQVAERVIGRGGRVRVVGGDARDVITTIAALPKIPFQLGEINFYGTDGTFTDQDIADFDRLSAVENLNLSPSKIGDDGIAVLGRIASLKFVHLGSSGVEGPGLVHLLNLPQLTRLDFGDHSLNDKALPLLAQFTKLETLNLWRTQVTDLSFLGAMPKLHTLVFPHSTVVDFSPLATLTELRDVDLRSGYLIDADLKHFSQLKQLAALRLGNNDLTDVGIMYLAGLPNLKYLELAETYVTEVGMKKLAATLSDCQITVKTKGGSPPSTRRTPPRRTR